MRKSLGVSTRWSGRTLRLGKRFTRSRPKGALRQPQPAPPTRKADQVATYAPEVAPFSWTGGHLGVFGGATLFTPSGAVPSSSPGLQVGRSVVGGLVGASAGYDWRSGHFVYGIAGDFARVFTDRYMQDGFPFAPSGIVVGTFYRTDTIATLRARAGIAVDRALLFGTFGIGGVRAGSGCLNSFPRMISGVPPGLVVRDRRWSLAT